MARTQSTIDRSETPQQFDLAFRPRSYRWPRTSFHTAASSAAETVIARIVFATAHRDVVSLRARRGADDRIRYRMVREGVQTGGYRISLRPTSSREPLSLGELVELLDTTYYEGACSDPYDQECYGRVIWGTLKLHFEHGVGGADDYLFFVSIDSDYYPQLQAYYRERFADWCLEHCEEEEECGELVRMKMRRG